MAATQIHVTNQTPNAGTPVVADALGAGFYFVDTNERSGVVDVKIPELLQFVVIAGETDVTVKVGPGDYPPALAAAHGVIETVVAAGETALIGPFESGRVQSEHVDVANIDKAPGDAAETPLIVHAPVLVELDGGSATVAAFRFPRHT